MQREGSRPIWLRALMPLCDGGSASSAESEPLCCVGQGAAVFDLPCLDMKRCRGTISSASFSSSPCGTGAGGGRGR